ncbi:MAG: prolyl oligopeptidase family serine peptidase [Bacteroidia bacterium]
MHTLLRPLICCTLLTVSLATAAQDSTWSVRDVVRQERVDGIVFSPDGQRVAWTQRRPEDKKDRFVSDLFLSRLDMQQDGGYRETRLTRSDESDYSPLFSHDGETLYFLSSRDKGKQLWSISLWGGEAQAVDSFPNGIGSPRWRDDSTLLYLAEEGPTLHEQELKRKKDNVEVVEDTAHFKPLRVFAYHLKDKRSTRLTTNRYRISSYAVSRDGRWLVTAQERSPHYGVDGRPEAVYHLWDLRTGSATAILQDYQTPGGFQFDASHRGFYFSAVRSSDPQWLGSGIRLLYYFDLATGQVSVVDLVSDWGLGEGFDVVGDHVLASLARGPYNELAWYERGARGWTRLPVGAGDKDLHLSVEAVSRAGDRAVLSYSTASKPVQYLVAQIVREKKGITLGDMRPLTRVNKHLDKKRMARSEVVRWQGALDDEITGILYYPTDYRAGQRYPLMVAIHGGPSGVDRDQWNDRWSYYPHLLAQRGCFVLMPNYHGSSNHGQAFVESIKGHYYEYELTDILRGIDYLAGRSLIDPDSLALMGWSNGAILTTMLTVQYPGRFMAAAPGAGDVNWTSDYGTCEFGVTFDQSYMGGAPWDDRDGKPYNEVYILKSPLFELEKVQTPTLIHHGSEDRAVPRDQGWEYYRALQQSGKTPVRFLWYPGQPHGLQKLSHQMRKIEEELRWFDTYFFKTYRPENEAFKKGSRLAQRLERARAGVQDGLLGVMANKVLLPAFAVAHPDSIALSVFELTHAQYQQFRREHAYPPVQANHPVTGLDQATIAAYLDWLHEETGHSYRLPTAAEAAALHKQARDCAADENTLAYWAGYAITRDEVPLLQARIDSVAGTLLLPGGSFKAVKVGQAALYDLGGNAAEYYLDGGTLRSYGYSAYDLADLAAEQPASLPAHTGLRIVRVLKE